MLTNSPDIDVLPVPIKTHIKSIVQVTLTMHIEYRQKSALKKFIIKNNNFYSKL